MAVSHLERGVHRTRIALVCKTSDSWNHTVYNADSMSLNRSEPGMISAGLTPLTTRPKLLSFEASAEPGRGKGASSKAMLQIQERVSVVATELTVAIYKFTSSWSLLQHYKTEFNFCSAEGTSRSHMTGNIEAGCMDIK